eukprot:2683433-Pyramimonas_sp.AAC.1
MARGPRNSLSPVVIENMRSLGLQCQMRRLGLVSRATLCRIACNSIEFFRARTRMQAMATNDECAILWDRDPLWLQSCLFVLCADFNQLRAIAQAPTVGAPRIQAATESWFRSAAREGFRVALLYRVKKFGVSSR